MIPREYIRCAAAQESPGAPADQGTTGNRYGQNALAAIPAELSDQLADRVFELIEEEDARACGFVCRERLRADTLAREQLDNRGLVRGADPALEAVPKDGHDSPPEV